MHRRASFSIAFAALLLGQAHAAEFTLQIDNVPEGGGGALMIQVLDSADAFNGNAPALANLILPATAPSVTFTTTALPSGTYAVRVMLDQNGNGELDTNVVGMPTEPWGMSNNAAGSFGPPKWQDARYELDKTATQVIRLNH